MMHAEIKAAIAANKKAIELASADVIDQDAMQEALEDVRTCLYDALTSALGAIETDGEQAKRLRDLEAQVAARDDWAKEAEAYELREVATSVQAWVKKDVTGYLGSAVKLCTVCFAQHKMMILQVSQTRSASGGAMRESIECGGCGNKIGFNGGFLTAS